MSNSPTLGGLLVNDPPGGGGSVSGGHKKNMLTGSACRRELVASHGARLREGLGMVPGQVGKLAGRHTGGSELATGRVAAAGRPLGRRSHQVGVGRSCK